MKNQMNGDRLVDKLPHQTRHRTSLIPSQRTQRELNIQQTPLG